MGSMDDRPEISLQNKLMHQWTSAAGNCGNDHLPVLVSIRSAGQTIDKTLFLSMPKLTADLRATVAAVLV